MNISAFLSLVLSHRLFRLVYITFDTGYRFVHWYRDLMPSVFMMNGPTTTAATICHHNLVGLPVDSMMNNKNPDASQYIVWIEFIIRSFVAPVRTSKAQPKFDRNWAKNFNLWKWTIASMFVSFLEFELKSFQILFHKYQMVLWCLEHDRQQMPKKNVLSIQLCSFWILKCRLMAFSAMTPFNCTFLLFRVKSCSSNSHQLLVSIVCHPFSSRIGSLATTSYCLLYCVKQLIIFVFTDFYFVFLISR